MKLTPYKKLIALAKDAQKALLAGPRAAEQKLRAQHEVSKIDVQLAEHEQKIQEVCAEHPINFDKLIQTIDDIALLERRKKLFGKIIEELFPESE
jgi:siroheme synthase